MVGPGVHVHARQGIHYTGHRRLPRSWLRPDRLFRSRYRRATDLDSAVDRDQRNSPAAERTRQGARAGARHAVVAIAAPSRKSCTMMRQRRTKIVATLGPASSDHATMAALFAAGADVFRINMSHTTHDRMRELVRIIREIEQEHGRPIAALVDLQGPKLRIGTFGDDVVTLIAGANFVLDADPAPGDRDRVYLPHPEILTALKRGHSLLLDDGKIRLLVLEASPKRAVARVEVGGKLSARKGVSAPNTVLGFSALTGKDHSDLEAALDAGADWIALSFVQRPEDIAEAKKIARGRAAVMAKMEKPQAIERLPEIIDAADGLMVARGDLGVELPVEKVPALQKQMTRAARRAGKPVVVATQMLESMISSPVPTRAEVSDVATAIYEGADAVMLSAESAAGQYPVEAVATMNRIAMEVERDPTYRTIIQAQRAEPEATGADAIAAAARQIAETLDLNAVVCWTSSGATALRVARERPQPPTMSISPNVSAGRKLALVWGVHSVVAEDARDQDDMVDRACRIAFKEGLARAGERIIIVAGVPLGTPGATNMVRIAFVSSGADTHEGNAHHIGHPRRSERHSGHDDDALARPRKSFLEGNAARAVDHIVLIAGILRNHAVHAPYQRKLAAGRDVRRNRHDRRPRPLAGDPQCSGAGRGPAHHGVQVERFGDLARSRRYGVR